MSIKFKQQRQNTCLLAYATNEDSNQPVHSRSLIRIFYVRMKNFCILSYSKCAKWRFWSDCAKAQADLNLRWARMSEGAGCTFFDVKVHLMIDR